MRSTELNCAKKVCKTTSLSERNMCFNCERSIKSETHHLHKGTGRTHKDVGTTNTAGILRFVLSQLLRTSRLDLSLATTRLLAGKSGIECFSRRMFDGEIQDFTRMDSCSDDSTSERGHGSHVEPLPARPRRGLARCPAARGRCSRSCVHAQLTRAPAPPLAPENLQVRFEQKICQATCFWLS